MGHSTGRHTSLVAGTTIGPWPRWPLGIHMESASIIQSAKGMKSCDGGRQWPLLTTSPLIPAEIQVHAASGPAVWQSRLLACATIEDPHLCESLSILGGKGPTTNPQWALLSGKECDRAPVGDGAAGNFHQWGSPQGCSALQPGGD